MDTPQNSTFSQNSGNSSQQFQSAGPMTVVNNFKDNKNYNQYIKLVEEFENELATGEIEFRQFIDKIQHFVSNIDGDEFIGLEKKLGEAGYQEYYQWARNLKEYYFKKITENSLSKATQKIHAFLLARVCVLFNIHVKGAINDGEPKEFVRELIVNKIIQPIQEMLGEKNVLDLYEDDIAAMIYFLTGNCHIRWK